MSAPTSPLGEVLKEGELWKRSKKHGSWVKRTVCLTTNQLRILNKDRGKAKTVLDLRVVTAVVPASALRKHCFEVLTGCGGWALAAQSDDEAAQWSALVSKAVARQPPPNERLLLLFRSADRDGSGSLELQEAIKLLDRLHVQVSSQVARKRVAEVDADRNGSLDFSEFEQFFNNLVKVDALSDVFRKLSNGAPYIDVRGIAKFAAEIQVETSFGRQQAQAVADKHASHELGTPYGCLDVRGFTEWLTSPSENGPLDATVLNSADDMTRPLSHYFIASSHNTYLEGNQLKGTSSTRAYESAIAAGVRCVEIDTWDGPNGEPIVYHGHTLTSKVLLSEVLSCIRDCAFAPGSSAPGNFPLIISLENHCGPQQQRRMAEHFRRIFGDKLAAPFGSGALLSPEALTGKLILKGKVLSVSGSPLPPVSLPSPVEDPKGKKAKPKKKTKKPKAPVEAEMSELTHLGTYSVPHGKLGPESDLAGGRHPRMMASLSEGKLKSILCRTGKTEDSDDSDDSDSDGEYYDVFGDDSRGTTSQTDDGDISAIASAAGGESMDSLFQASKTSPEMLHALQRHNSVHLTRIYPKGLRVGSSNYRPDLGWSAGCQLVALNYQTSSLSMWANAALFSLNRGCGYVLKPEWMIRGEEPPVDKHRRLRIRVVCARQLPSGKRDVINPLVEVVVLGYHADLVEARTREVVDNAWNPTWDQEFVFLLRAPEIDVLHFAIWDHDTSAGNRIAQATIPVRALKTGFRAVPLRDKSGNAIDGTFILCQFSFI